MARNENKVRVTNTTSRSLGLPQCEPYVPHALLPGGNNVYEGHLELLDTNAAVRDWFDRGWLVLETSGEHLPEGPPPPDSLDSYGDEAAIKLVALEDDPDIIEVWRLSEDRLKVIQAMNSRIAALRPGSEED